jgi:hypothetical protein
MAGLLAREPGETGYDRGMAREWRGCGELIKKLAEARLLDLGLE